MDNNIWELKVQKILGDSAFSIISLFSYGTTIKTVDKVKSYSLNIALNNISDFKKIIICFDLEFQNTLYFNDSNYVYENNKSCSFIREFGLLIFIKAKSWYYIGNIILNFPSLGNADYIRYTSLTYSAVTADTAKAMKINDDVFDKEVIFDLYPVLEKNKDVKDIIMMQNYLYWKDPFVKNRTLNLDQASIFLKLFLSFSNKAMYILKGQSDIKVIRNHYYLFFKEINIFPRIYDIEMFNGFSKYLFNSAKLEETFNGLIKLPVYRHCLFFDKYIKNLKAHNPVSDSFYTIIIAVIINLLLLKN